MKRIWRAMRERIHFGREKSVMQLILKEKSEVDEKDLQSHIINRSGDRLRKMEHY